MVLVEEGDPSFPKYEAPYLKLFGSDESGNAKKIGILLNLLKPNIEVPIHQRPISLQEEVQKQPWYLKINPAGKVPTLLDVDSKGNITTISESAAILTYLIDKYDTNYQYSYAKEDPLYYQQLQWLYYATSELTPTQVGLLIHKFLSPEKNEKEIESLTQETLRIYAVLESRLESNGTGYFVGDHLSIVDVACYPYVIKKHIHVGGDLSGFPALSKWLENLKQNEAFEKGMSFPTELKE